MTKLEEKLEMLPIKIIRHPVGDTKYYAAVHVKSLISQADEEFQELLDKYSNLNDNYEKEVIKSSKLESQIIDLKTQLQQQALPVVPECVAEFIEDCKKEGDCLFGIFADATSVEHDMPDLVYFWLGDEGNNDELFARAWLNGYEVEKPQLFYLKHIDMSKRDKENDYFAQIRNDRFEHDSVRNNTLPGVEVVGVKFTQQEIDSMSTGSYEQIEVAE